MALRSVCVLNAALLLGLLVVTAALLVTEGAVPAIALLFRLEQAGALLAVGLTAIVVIMAVLNWRRGIDLRRAVWPLGLTTMALLASPLFLFYWHVLPL